MPLTNPPRLRTRSIARGTEDGQDSTSGIISLPTLFMSCLLDAEVNLVAGRSQRLPMFIATCLLLQCWPLTMQMCNHYSLRNGQTLSAIRMRVFAQTALELALLRAGLIQVPLHYRLLVSLAPLDAIASAAPRSRNLTWPCKRAFN